VPETDVPQTDTSFALPCLLHGFSRLPGVIKAQHSDFVVHEEPLYTPSGEGTHTYFLIEKSGISTLQAVNVMATALNVGRRDIGFAGMKDAHAVARQWLSVEHVAPKIIEGLELPRIRVLDVTRHTNKLRLGHLRANRFVVKVRQTEPQRVSEVQAALDELARRGVPNYFGPQRFGTRGTTWEIGQAIVQNQPDRALDVLLGRPTPADHGAIRRARKLYDLGKYADAVRQWPGVFADERRALRVLARTGNRRRAWGAVGRRTKLFYLSAYQSYLFNQVVAQRLPHGLDHLWEGDLAWIHAKGAVFQVLDPVVEQPRADAFEISPTGPLFGNRMSSPSGHPAEMEARVLAAQGLPPAAFSTGPGRSQGGRRPLRFRPEMGNIQLGADDGGPYLELRFTLPPGCYATCLLRELFSQAERAPSADDLDGTEEQAG